MTATMDRPVVDDLVAARAPSRGELLRWYVRAGFTTECAAAGVDPDEALKVLLRHDTPRTVWFPCVRACFVVHPIDGRKMPRIAWSPTASPEDAVCSYCLADDRRRA